MPLLNRVANCTLSRHAWAAWLLLPSLTIGCGGKGSDSPRPPQPPVNTAESSSSAITLTGYSTQRGPAGTRVTITGLGFSAINRVSFGELAGLDLVVNGDTEILVTVPPGAEGEELACYDRAGRKRLGLTIGARRNPPRPPAPGSPGGTVTGTAIPPAGGTGAAPAPQDPHPVTPARSGRLAHLGANLTVVERPWESAARCLDFPAARRTAQYGDLFLPQAPVLHPYNPWIEDDGSIRPGNEHPEFTLNLRLPGDFLEAVPPQVQEWLVQKGIKAEHTELFVVSQNQPWNETVPMLFRPHYWVFPDVPYFGTFSQEMALRIGFYQGGSHTVLLDGRSPSHGGVSDTTGSISTHDSGPGTMLISSPNNLPVTGLNPGTSNSFWTMVARPDGRAAVTLHLLLNDADQAFLADVSKRVHSLEQLITELNTDAGRRSNAFPFLCRLAGPVIHTVLTEPAPDNPGMLRLTLEGSGFSGMNGVVVNGNLVQNPVVTSDSRCQVLVPGTELNGHIAAFTHLGGSESVPAR